MLPSTRFNDSLLPRTKLVRIFVLNDSAAFCFHMFESLQSKTHAASATFGLLEVFKISSGRSNSVASEYLPPPLLSDVQTDSRHRRQLLDQEMI